eukprot:scaffold49414_cov35-Phaeocystis_antarctica.AAC.3
MPPDAPVQPARLTGSSGVRLMVPERSLSRSAASKVITRPGATRAPLSSTTQQAEPALADRLYRAASGRRLCVNSAGALCEA